MQRWSSPVGLSLALGLSALGAACGTSTDTPSGTGAIVPFGTSNTPEGTAPANPPAATANTSADSTAAGSSPPSGEAPASALPLGMPAASTSATSSDTGAPVPSSTPPTPLPRATPESQGVSSAGLLQLVNALDSGIDEIHSLMLVRHGRVIAEGWWSPYRAEDIHVLYSGTKSFNSTAVGLLIAEGKLSVDDLVLSKFPDLAPAQPSPNMAAMKIKDLLTMSTGHTADTIDTLRAAPNGAWTKAFLATDVPDVPGSLFVYNSGAAYVLGAIVQRAAGMSVEDYLTPRLFEPLQIQQHLWGKSPEGVNMADGGLSVRTEDFAKFGLLYLNGGSWNGQQVVPADWVTAATSKEVSTGNDDGNWNYGYGYQFWRNPPGGFRADGSLGQFSFVLPDQDVVLAVTSGTNSTDQLMTTVWNNLMPALKDAALPEDSASQQALTQKLQGLSLTLPSGNASSPMAAGVSGTRFTAQSNSQGITALQLDFDAESPTLHITDADGEHIIPVGVGTWARGRTDFKKHINDLFDTTDEGIAAMGAWTANDTFTARLVFTETPYTVITAFKFGTDRVALDVSYNVRWESTTEPEVVATR
jgi:CubicO group peptidase (beta-lactamase class C family)